MDPKNNLKMNWILKKYDLVLIILDKLNGKVEIKTELNKGTTFIFTLPLKNK